MQALKTNPYESQVQMTDLSNSYPPNLSASSRSITEEWLKGIKYILQRGNHHVCIAYKINVYNFHELYIK